MSKSHQRGFRAPPRNLGRKEHDVGDEQRRCRDAAACRADARWGRRSRNASHSPARQRRWCRAAAHPLSGSPEASAHVQVQRKYGWELSNRVCRARGAAAHACAPGLSTGRRLMPMPARCGAAAPCRGAATVRRSPHEESTAASAAGKRLSVWSAQSSCNCSDHQTFACLCMRGRGRKLVAIQTEACVCSSALGAGLLLGTVRRPTDRAPEPGRQKKADAAHA